MFFTVISGMTICYLGCWYLVSVFSNNYLLLIQQSMNLFKIYFSPLLYSHFLSFNFFSKHTAFVYDFFNLVSNLCFHFRSVIKYIILLPPVLLPKFLQLFLGWMKVSLYVWRAHGTECLELFSIVLVLEGQLGWE